MKPLNLQRGFIDYLLLRIAENFSWRIRYPTAAGVAWLAWWLFTHQFLFFAAMFLFCAAILAKEISPSLLLLVAATWIWPTDFLSIPFSQMTFGLLGRGILSALLVFASVAVALWVYAAKQNTQVDNSTPSGPATLPRI